MERRNVYKSVEEREGPGRNNVIAISQYHCLRGIYYRGAMLPVPVSADSQHLLDEPEPDELHGSAWPSPPWHTGRSPALQLQPEAPWCWLPHLWLLAPMFLKPVLFLWQPHLQTSIHMLKWQYTNSITESRKKISCCKKGHQYNSISK